MTVVTVVIMTAEMMMAMWYCDNEGDGGGDTGHNCDGRDGD